MNGLSNELKIKANGLQEAEIWQKEDRSPEKEDLLVSCLEDQVVTQQPAWIGQRRCQSSTTFNELATGSIFSLKGQKLREIGQNKDGRSGTLLEKITKIWKLWEVITQQQSAWFGWGKLQSWSILVGRLNPTINSSRGRKTGDIQPDEEGGSENGSEKVSVFGWG